MIPASIIRRSSFMNEFFSSSPSSSYPFVINPSSTSNRVVNAAVNDVITGDKVVEDNSPFFALKQSTSFGEMNFCPAAKFDLKTRNFNYKNGGRRSPPPNPKMNAAYPEDLSPNDHPILKHCTRQRSSSTSVLEIPIEKSCNLNLAPSFPPVNTSISDKPRRPKGIHQPLSRYHTTPITFEEISEIDEELYLKQQQNLKDDDVDEKRDNALLLRRTSSFNSGVSPSSKKSCFDFRTTAKTRSYSAGAVLFSSSTSPPKPNSLCVNRNKQRSQESLIQSGSSTLPTIPEEWRQQQQQNHQQQEKQVHPDQQTTSLEESNKQLISLQRSYSADEPIET